MKRLLLVLGFVTALSACGSKDSPPLATYTSTGGSTAPTGGRSHTGGKSGTATGTTPGGTGTSMGGTGTSVGERTSVGGASSTSTGAGGVTSAGGATGTTTTATGGVDQLALLPVVTIIAPLAASNASTDGDAGTDAGVDPGPVLIDTPVEVLCQASKSAASGASNISPSTVQLALKPAGATGTQKTGGVVANQVDTYSASFSIIDLPTGEVDIGCAASDVATPPHSNSTTLSTFIDHGPLISNVLPAPNAAFPVKQAVHFEFQLTPQELVPGDTGAQIGNVSLTVAGLSVPVQPDIKRPGYYVSDVDFGNPAMFSTPPTGKTNVVIVAENRRSNPKPAQAKNDYYILIDGTAPTINITKPAPNTVLGAQVALTFTVTDDLAGVDPSSVVVNLISDKQVPYNYKPSDSSWTYSLTDLTATFTLLIDSSKFDKSIDQVSISVNASDLAGNNSSSDTKFYYIDSQPPFVSLNPPNIRLITTETSALKHCSVPFDPLGTAMPNPGMIVYNHEIYRAFAWDITNGLGSALFLQFAGIDPTKVHLYLQADPTKGIVFDSDGDGICDKIVQSVHDASGQPPLVPIDAQDDGTATYSTQDFTTAPNVSNWPCATDGDSPAQLCLDHVSDMNVVVHQLYAGQSNNLAAIYGLQVATGTHQCTGLDWNITGIAQEGWICLAAEATDSVGNTGISAPIALCYDDQTTSYVPPCATGKQHYISGLAPPSCIIDMCTPPSMSPPPATATTNSIGYYVDTASTADPPPFYIVYN